LDDRSVKSLSKLSLQGRTGRQGNWMHKNF